MASIQVSYLNGGALKASELLRQASEEIQRLETIQGLALDNVLIIKKPDCSWVATIYYYLPEAR